MLAPPLVMHAAMAGPAGIENNVRSAARRSAAHARAPAASLKIVAFAPAPSAAADRNARATNGPFAA